MTNRLHTYFAIAGLALASLTCYPTNDEPQQSNPDITQLFDASSSARTRALYVAWYGCGLLSMKPSEAKKKFQNLDPVTVNLCEKKYAEMLATCLAYPEECGRSARNLQWFITKQKTRKCSNTIKHAFAYLWDDLKRNPPKFV